ncbi:MAG TPA: hypothetical protein VHN79_06630 [Lacunisphaera sp.]|nr:hypothetical protein [Lacunisphaera sp.]
MKHLLPPTFAVVFSTAGTAYGCHASGMPAGEVATATLLAGTVSFVAAFGAVLLARRRRTMPIRTVATRLR